METFQNIGIILMVITIMAEVVISSLHQLELFDSRDSVANILLGIFTILVGMVMKGLTLKIFAGIQEYALTEISFSWSAVILLFLISDLYYYGFHVLAHHCRFVWASHVVHHSSSKYNLTVAMRLPFTNGIYRFTFWTPLCLAGFPPALVMMMDTAVVFYTFFLHTETIGNLGWFEKYFNTPSHHRVHHSSNPAYLDKNFGGVLIVWDKLFGTFIAEKELPRYGTTKKFHSYNPVTIICDEWVSMFRDLRKARSIKERLFFIFGDPSRMTEKKKKYIAQPKVTVLAKTFAYR